MANISDFIGGFVRTIHGVNGILIDVKNGYGGVAFIATSDMRTFHCPAYDVILPEKKKEVRL